MIKLSPVEARQRIEEILSDPNHPYNNDRVTPQAHKTAVDSVNKLYEISMGDTPADVEAVGYAILEKRAEEERQAMIDSYGCLPSEDKTSSNEVKESRLFMNPAEAQRELAKIFADKSHPYMNDTAPLDQRSRAVERVQTLLDVVGQAGGALDVQD